MPRDSRYDFDGPRFVDDAQKACRGLGITMSKAAQEIGIDAKIFSLMPHGRTPNGRALLGMCVYLGMDPRDYLIDLDDPGVPKPPPHIKRWSFTAALQRIKQLEEELKNASQST